MLNLNILAFIVPQISTFTRTDRQTDGRGQIKLAIDADQECFLLYIIGKASFCLLHTFQRIIVYPFTLRNGYKGSV